MKYRPILLAVLCLMPVLAGCSVTASFDDLRSIYTNYSYEESKAEQVQKSDTLRLPYDPKDSLNPYTLTTRVNYDISTLLYDPLFRLDPDFYPQPVLAARW